MRGAALWPHEESMRVGRHGWVGTWHGYQTEGLPRRSGAGPKVDLAATGHAGATGRRTSNAARALRACRARRTTSKAYGPTDRRVAPWRWRVVGKQTHRPPQLLHGAHGLLAWRAPGQVTGRVGGMRVAVHSCGLGVAICGYNRVPI